MNRQFLPGPPQTPVRFDLPLEDRVVDVVGYIYSDHITEFNDTPYATKRLLLCLTAFDNRSGKVIKNPYGRIHKDVKL